MLTITGAKELSELLEERRKTGGKIGFVPTMGALHDGHISLVEKAASENDIVVASVFVNPAQFNDKSDLEHYPRTFDADQKLLQNSGCDILFFPSIEEMYPAGPDVPSIQVDLGGLDKVMEGKFRPGHFEGVVKVLKRFFDITGFCNAYFGEKDFQQLAIVKRMVSELRLPVHVVGCPIKRENDGLAMSSRNTRLTIEERKIAGKISIALRHAESKWNARSVSETIADITAELTEEKAFRIDYIEIADRDTLQPLSENEKRNAIVCVAVFLGQVRLIDNIFLS